MHSGRVATPLDIDLLDDDDPFEIDRRAAGALADGRRDRRPCARRAVGATGRGDPSKCRPIGCYVAAEHLASRYREDR